MFLTNLVEENHWHLIQIYRFHMYVIMPPFCSVFFGNKIRFKKGKINTCTETEFKKYIVETEICIGKISLINYQK